MPLDLIDELEGLIRAWNGAGIPYAVCGGIAVTLHGATRSTKDIDVLVRPEDVERASRAAAGLGFTAPAAPMIFDAGTPRERRVHRVNKFEGETWMTLDLLEAGPSLAGVLDDRREFLWRGLPLWAVSRRGLEIMKRMAGRLQDLADLEKLEAAGGGDA